MNCYGWCSAVWRPGFHQAQRMPQCEILLVCRIWREQWCIFNVTYQVHVQTAFSFAKCMWPVIGDARNVICSPMISALSSGERNWLPRMTSTHHSLGTPQSRTLCLSSWNSGTSLFHSIFFISSCCGNWTSRTTIFKIFVTQFGLTYGKLLFSTNLHLKHPTAFGCSCAS